MGSGPQRPQIGRAVRRTEDRRLVTGAGGYLADLRTPGTAYLHLIRSAAAHARIAELDVEAARVLPGVGGG